MIGNTFSQMADAQKLSPQQLQLAIQHGTVPSYIGIPLLQEKLKQSQEAQALAGGHQKPPTIAQQVMQQAQAQHGVEALPSGLPEEAMAGGGIVAFADGGMYDGEDTDEDRLDEQENAEYDDLLNQAMEAYQSGIGSLPAAVAPEQGKESNADFIARIMQKESRGKRYDKEGKLLTSEKGAMGEMQVMPGTVRDPGFGVKPAQSEHPDELARVGRDYANTLLQRYGDPKLAAIAYNMGPGATDKWLAAGADVSKLPRETQGYVKGFAKGGDIDEDTPAGIWPYNSPDAGNFMYGSESKDDEKPSSGTRSQKAALSGLADLFSNSGSNSPRLRAAKQDAALLSGVDLGGPGGSPANTGIKPLANSVPVAPAVINYDQASNADDQSFGPGAVAATPVATQPTATQAAVTPDRFAKYEELFGKREANLEKQREQDKYMALLSAGLGMMGGTSPNALANIGAGGQQGLASLLAANKDRTAEENAILSGRLGLEKIGAMAENQKEKMALSRELAGQTNARLTQAAQDVAAQRAASLEERTRKDLAGQLSQMEKLASTKFLAKMKNQIIPGQESALEAQALEGLYSDPAYRALYKKVHGMDPMGGSSASSGGGTRMRFDASGNQIK